MCNLNFYLFLSLELGMTFLKLFDPLSLLHTQACIIYHPPFLSIFSASLSIIIVLYMFEYFDFALLTGHAFPVATPLFIEIYLFTPCNSKCFVYS